MQSAAIFSLYAFFFCSFLLYCSARDTITFNNSITDESGETLVSILESFELGFFTPNRSSSSKRYVGIWYYNITPQTVVWVANRDRPLHDRSGSFAITDDGSLKVLDGKGNLYWSGVLESWSFNSTAKLMDSGNLILRDAVTEKTLWESFRKPTDTFLPGMKMDEDLQLTSWTSGDDPAKGNFTFGRDQSARDQFIIRKKSIPYWKSEHDQSVSDLLVSYLSNFDRGGLYLPFPNLRNYDKSRSFSRLVISFSGEIEYRRWDVEKNWILFWKAPRARCVVGSNPCGNFGICNKNNAVECKCLPGFEPRSLESWHLGSFADGCERKTPICGSNTQIVTFTSLKNMNVGNPYGRISTRSETECRDDYCLPDCDCQAYSYDINATDRCLIWKNELNNLQEYADGGRSLSLRVNPFNKALKVTPPKKMPLTTIIAVTITTVVVFIAASCAIVYYSYLRRRRVAKRRENEEDLQQNEEPHSYNTESRLKNLIDSDHFREEDKKDIDIPFFSLESILSATDNFSNANKLGKGGFGPVYKGKFPGREIAVKRLSSTSGQGLKEFKNEVILIAKLQHRNLVRLLGYCVKGEEKILLYKYMPNKSLDSFIFDRTSSVLLDWELRFKIILGIARGLLYLHEDSRLRIIHRDLKTSNILLDEEMSPKISDFGLARIFGGKQIEGNTNKVVGTYGYMSPEYALDGFFSIKSNVFSFGVVVLEIISGIRNTGFYQSEQALSLLGYAWRLWNEDKALDLMDRTVCETCNTNEFLKCMNVGLLCVQDDPSDRPTMSNVVAVLVSETATLPTPKQPAFVSRRDPSTTASSSSRPEACSINDLTVTVEQGR